MAAEIVDLNGKLSKFGMRLEFWPVKDLLELVKKTRNPKKHFNKDIAAIAGSVEDLGFKSAIVINKEATEIGAGVGRIQAVARTKKYDELPVFRVLDLSKAKFKKLRIADNRLPQLSDKWDEQILVEDLFEIKQAAESIDFLEFRKYESQLKADMAAEEAQVVEQAVQSVAEGEPFRAPGSSELGGAEISLPASMPQMPDKIVEAIAAAPNLKQPDTFYPSDNEWGIPTLSKKYMADKVGDAFVKWGEISRKAKMTGTWNFYVEDQKFKSLWNDPTGPLYSGAQACVEVNYTVSDQIPRAWALWQTYKKRYLARYWQANGMKIFVDLNVNDVGVDLNQIGIPDGWLAWFTRGYNSNLAGIKKDYQIATTIAGTDDPAKGFIFGIYGGGQDVKALAAELEAVWFPERMQEVSSGNIASGQKLKVEPDEYADLS